MNPTSALQQQFPLSPRKYWKKMIQSVLGWYILALIGFVICIVIMFITSSTINSLGREILWGIILVGLVFLFIITLLYSLYIKAYIRRYYYAGEDHFITIKKGVFTPAEIHVQWQKIQDVYVDQDLLDRMMGLYDVHIASATAASGIEAHIDGVGQAAAEGLKKFLLDKVSAEKISSTTYPLSGKWMAVETVKKLLAPFLYWAFLILIFSGQLLKDFSWQSNIIYILLGWIAISILSGIINVIALFIWRKNYAFDFGPDNLYYKVGVISLSEKHMPYSSIQDVTIRQGILDRIFGLADVRVENAAQQMIQTRQGRMPISAGIVLQGFSLASANKITDILKTTVLSKNNYQSQYGL